MVGVCEPQFGRLHTLVQIHHDHHHRPHEISSNVISTCGGGVSSFFCELCFTIITTCSFFVVRIISYISSAPLLLFHRLVVFFSSSSLLHLVYKSFFTFLLVPSATVWCLPFGVYFIPPTDLPSPSSTSSQPRCIFVDDSNNNQSNALQ